MLSEINSRLENLLEFKYGNQYRKYSGIEKEEKKWIEKYIVNYDLLSHKKIRISQFIKRVTAESIQLKAEEEVIKQEVKDGFKKTKRTAKRETIESPIRQRTPSPFELEQQLVDKKQEDGKQRLQFYRKQLQNRDKQIDKLQKLHQQEKYCMVQDYQARIKLIKKGIMENSDDKTDYLVKENQKLKNKINQLEKSFRQNERERQLEEERIKLYHEIERLKIENQKLKAQSEIHCENIENIYIVKIEMLEKRLKQMERKNQERGKNEYSLDHFNGNDKKNKQIQGITEQLKIYKEELLNQREKFEKKQRIYDKKVAQLEAQNQSLSQTVTKMHRKIDLKELQIAQLEQQVRLYKQYDRQVNMQSDSISNQNNRYQLRSPEISIKEKTFQFKKYESLRNHYGSKKELFIRFCRCSLRKKDIILKQNQLEVGLITEPLSQNQIKFVIHFTNMSEVQFNNIELNIERPSHINVQASSLFLLCLHRQMQQKITIRCTQNKVLSKIYEPIILNITFSKRNVPHKLKVNLPFLLLKTLQFYKPNQNNNNNLWHEHGYNLALHYSKKILPNSGYLKNYFEKMEETSTGVLECEAFQRASGLKFRIGIRILIEGEGMIMIQAIPIKGKQKWSQQYEDIIEDFMGFMEFVFRK